MIKRLYTNDNWEWQTDPDSWKERRIYVPNFFIDLIIRAGSLWIGAHFSKKQRSVCIALLPCVVIRIGRTEYKPEGEK